MFALACAVYHPHPWQLERVTAEWLCWPIFALANLLVVLGNLWPHQIKTALGVLPSDGLQILHAILGKNKHTPEERHAAWFRLEAVLCLENHRFDEALAWVERGLAVSPASSLKYQPSRSFC